MILKIKINDYRSNQLIMRIEIKDYKSRQLIIKYKLSIIYSETSWENEIMENQVWILLWNKNQGKLGRKKKVKLKKWIIRKEQNCEIDKKQNQARSKAVTNQS